LERNPRFLDDPDTDDTGAGGPPIVDMGAYEYQGPPCPGDTDGNGVVDALDFLNVIVSWIVGCPPPAPFACGDVNGDGVVDALDLLVLIGNWGEC
jgi:hypothetical protein